MEEVRFDRMVPAMVCRRREECNLAYLPVGALEWHGPHMPFGTDYFTVTYLAEEAAKRFGGVAFPPMYYGDARHLLQECRYEWRQSYAQDMEVPERFASAFPFNNPDGTHTGICESQPDDGPATEEPIEFSRQGQIRDLTRLIASTMLSIHLYGFRHIVLLPGHGSNVSMCAKAPEVYRQNVLRRKALGPPAKAMSFFYLEAAKEFEPLLTRFWIHADRWEGSITMVAAPGTVHLDQLPEDPDALVPAFLGHPYINETDGHNPEYGHLRSDIEADDPRNGTSEEYGREQTEAVLGKFGEVIQDFMAEG